MKIKLLIVDDERHIRIGLQKTIDWAQIGISEVYVASNAHEGMTAFYRHRPQIVLMDLMLPGMDGIEACERIKREDKGVRIFVLTAHLKTEYVRRCLSLGIEEYFVKPAPIDEMVQRISMTVAELVEQTFKDALVSNSDAEYNWQLARMLQGHAQPLPTELALMGLNQPGKLKRMLAVDIYGDYDDVMKVCSAFQWHIAQQNAMCVSTLLYQGAHSVYVMLLEYESLNYAEFLRSMYEVIVDHCNEDGTLTVNIAVGSEQAAWSIEQMYGRLQEVLKSFFFIGANSLVEEDKLALSDSGPQVPSHAALSEIVNSVHPDELLDRLEELFEAFSRGGERAIAQVYALASELLLLIIDLRDPQARNELYDGFMCRLFDGSVRYLQDVQELILSAWEGMQRRADEVPDAVRKITRYVQLNYQRDLDVSMLAEHVGLSRNYVSHIFSLTCGKSIMQYLNEVRIEQAKKLLVQSELSLQDIASNVGYNNYTYFAKIFRQMMGVTPSAYRMESLDDGRQGK